MPDEALRRGCRIGRGKVRAYAYMTLPASKASVEAPPLPDQSILDQIIAATALPPA